MSSTMLPEARHHRVGADLQPAVDAIADGRVAILRDPRAGIGVLVAGGRDISDATMALIVRHSSGFVCVALPITTADRLDLPALARDDEPEWHFPFCVSVDAASGTTTGISAHDRALTCRVLSDPAAVADDLLRPGHVVPVRADRRGLLGTRGMPEAALELVRLATGGRAAVYAALVEDSDRRVATATTGALIVAAAAAAIGAPIVDVDSLTVAALELRSARAVSNVCELALPAGQFTATSFDFGNGLEFVTLQLTGAGPQSSASVIRFHRECVASMLGSRGCDCRDRLTADLHAAARFGEVVVVVRREPDVRDDHANMVAVADDEEQSALAAIAAHLGRAPQVLDGDRGSLSG